MSFSSYRERKSLCNCWFAKILCAHAGKMNAQQHTHTHIYIVVHMIYPENHLLPVVKVVVLFLKGYSVFSCVQVAVSPLPHGVYDILNWANLRCNWDLPCLLNFQIPLCCEIEFYCQPTPFMNACMNNMNIYKQTHVRVHTDIHTLCVATNQDTHLWLGHFESRVIK